MSCLSDKNLSDIREISDLSENSLSDNLSKHKLSVSLSDMRLRAEMDGIGSAGLVEQALAARQAQQRQGQVQDQQGDASAPNIHELHEHARRLMAKGRLNQRDQAWVKDYCATLPLVGASDRQNLDEVSDTLAISQASSPIQANPASFYDPQALPRIKLNELVQNPDAFNGSKPAPRRWLDDYERTAKADVWSEQLKVRYFSMLLESTAHDWNITVARRKLGLDPHWVDLRAAFMKHYLGDSDRRSLRKQLEATQQKDNERATNFIPRCLRIIYLVDDKMVEEEVVEIMCKPVGSKTWPLSIADAC